jgi:bifunctional DNA primase/polymerase-like protein
MMGQTPQANASLDHQTRLAAGQACLEAALNEYLPRGLSIICCCDPDHIGVGRDHGKTCDSPGKMPLCKWAEFQTRLPTIAEVRQLWKDFPYGNVGCVLGQVSGMVRVDVDGPSGEAKLQQWSKGDLPPTWEFTSSAESRGLLYAWPRALPCKTTSQRMKGDHEELRLMGNGSQTVLPPSRHPSGSLYAWKPSHNPHDIPLAPAPDWLLERLLDDSSRQGNTTTHLSGEIPAVDMEALGLDESTINFLHEGTWTPPSRSEPSFSVLKRLIETWS